MTAPLQTWSEAEEAEFEIRLWQNRLMNQIRDNLNLASKILFKDSTPHPEEE